jgi:hypothetical protein
MSLVAFCAVFATIGSGCATPGSGEFVKPVASGAAGAGPVVLNGAGGQISNPAAKVAVKAEPAPIAAAAPAAAPIKSAAAADPAARTPLFGAPTLPPLPETPAVAAAPPDPAADQAITKNADGYPNINSPPKEPASKLLPDDERARVISELEALRKKGDAGAKDSSNGEVTKKGGSKTKTAGKCPDGATSGNDSSCKASQ